MFVYQPGKVGSSSILAALRNRLPTASVVHLHLIDGAVDHHLMQLALGIDEPRGDLEFGRAIARDPEGVQQLECRIITMLRDPIAREISGLFEEPRLYGFDPDQVWRREDVVADLERRLADPGTFAYTVGWFDRELRAVFGVDPLSAPFDQERGWQTYRHGNCEVLFIQTERLTEVGPEAVSEFLDLDSTLVLERVRARADGVTGPLYQEVLETIRVPEEALRVYDHPVVRHVYGDETLAEFRAGWQLQSRA